MGYAIDADRIVQEHRINIACTFNPDDFKHVAKNISSLLNERKLVARKIVARGLTEGDGAEYETLIAQFHHCETKIKQLLGF